MLDKLFLYFCAYKFRAFYIHKISNFGITCFNLQFSFLSKTNAYLQKQAQKEKSAQYLRKISLFYLYLMRLIEYTFLQ
jgi:hypothetical protein